MKIKVETEKKYYCLTPEELTNYAEELKFELVKNIHEVDEYFTDINSEFIKNRTCLRIRKQNKNMEITYKGKSTNSQGLYCKLENNIKCNTEEYDNFVKLFNSLGYYSYVEVIKERLIYKKENNKYSYSIMIDKLEELGCFVEFEIISEQNKSKRDDLKEELEKFIKKFEFLNLKEATKPYRDIIANHIYTKTVNKNNSKKILIDLDFVISNFEKDFFKKYKNELSNITGTNIKWGIYKKNNDLEPYLSKLIKDYLDNLIFDSNELLITFELLKQVNYKYCFITKINKLFFTEFMKKIKVKPNEVIYLEEVNIKKYMKDNNINHEKLIILNNKTLKEINSTLFIMVNNNE